MTCRCRVRVSMPGFRFTTWGQSFRSAMGNVRERLPWALRRPRVVIDWEQVRAQLRKGAR
jgi:hypothetical protein